MDVVTNDDLLKILDSMTPGLLSPAYGVFGSSFKYAKKHVLINKNPATSAISIKRKQVSKKEANERAAAANRTRWLRLIKAKNENHATYIRAGRSNAFD